MAAIPPHLASTAIQQVLPIFILGYLILIAGLALTAVFSSKPHRRRAAFDVLNLLLPGRRARGRPPATRALTRSADTPSEHKDPKP